jgi:hypothetical protein
MSADMDPSRKNTYVRSGHLIEGNVPKSIYGISRISGDCKVKGQRSAVCGESRVGGDAVTKRKKLCGVSWPLTHKDDGGDAACEIRVAKSVKKQIECATINEREQAYHPTQKAKF